MGCGAVIPAAGAAARFGDEDKTLRRIGDRSVLERVLWTLAGVECLDRIVIVVSGANQFPVLDLITRARLPVDVSTVLGGETRMESVRNGVDALPDETGLVLIHDAARPLVTRALIRDTIDAATEAGAAIPGAPVTDTIKQVTGGQVARTLDRSELVAVQTPQVFRRDWLLAAYSVLDGSVEVTDEAFLLELAGYPVRVIPGDPANIKVTTPSDAVVAEALLQVLGDGS